MKLIHGILLVLILVLIWLGLTIAEALDRPVVCLRDPSKSPTEDMPNIRLERTWSEA